MPSLVRRARRFSARYLSNAQSGEGVPAVKGSLVTFHHAPGLPCDQYLAMKASAEGPFVLRRVVVRFILRCVGGGHVEFVSLTARTRHRTERSARPLALAFSARYWSHEA